ncbi:hypothetical protein PSHT_01993 [Puccinia striiformis]|uniref:t-SNARE coiled-coil homology domain-containing protein n=1 Tax=Puccinia striiformis TaxID=27350 RepID=A0A2S4WJ20_9BASI|nr:hypothetical protein H4Q26_005718 [Puccinia striiformis f. sp. tritici PST-130]POW21790.1 hypothetical protein PSHT_01993 [Puccinia striiformis]
MLRLDSAITKVICCQECFAMYPITPNVPRRCVHCAFLIVSTPEGSIEISTLSNKDPEENVDAIEENIYAIEENIDAIEENIDAIEDNIDAIEENIDAIEENIDAITRDNSDNDSADDLDVCGAPLYKTHSVK